jgi:hypothetical protein
MFLPNTSQLDTWMRRVLFISPSLAPSKKIAPRVFGIALFISATRCVLQYLIFPFVLPFFGLVGGTPVWLSLPLCMIAFTSLLLSLRRFWKANHPRRFAYLPLALLMMIVLIIFVLSDLGLIHV